MKRYRRYLVRAALALAVALTLLAGWQATRLWLAWRSVERFEFDLAESRQLLPQTTSPPATAPATDNPDRGDEPRRVPLRPVAEPATFSLADDDLDAFLLVGTDEDKPSAVLDRADAILLFLRPHENHGPLLTSLPRDLWLLNPCTGAAARLSTVLEGCGEDIGGPELLALAVEDFTGLDVDHFAVLSFDAFTRAVDSIGGVEICLDNPMRVGVSGRSGRTELPAGCNLFDGDEALGWIRDRVAEEYVDGEWVPAPGGDAARAQRQQQLLVELLRRLKRFRSPLDVAGLAEDLSDAFALDESLSLPRAIDIVWDLRRVSPNDIARRTLEVAGGVTESGEFVLMPQQTFAELLDATYG